MTSNSIRRAKPSDILDVLQVLEDSVRSSKKEFSPVQISAWTNSKENIERWKEAIANQYFIVNVINSLLVLPR